MKEASLNDRQEVVNLLARTKTVIELSNGRKVKVGYIMGNTQDKLDALIVNYEAFKKTLSDSDEDINRGNNYTRRFYAQCAAVILMNSYIRIALFWWLKWRWMYYFGNYNGEDYLKIITEAKKKATEQEYSLAMVLLMDMTTTWTTMTKKEAEEYRQELELVREARSLKNSQH